MKSVGFLLILALIVGLIWTISSKPPNNNQAVVVKEKYGAPLGMLVDSILASLDKNSPSPVAEITRLAAEATTDARNGLIKEQEALLINQICGSLLEANQTREKFETRKQDVQAKLYVGLDAESSARTKQYYLTGNQNNWIEYCQKTKKPILVTLNNLAKIGGLPDLTDPGFPPDKLN